MALCLESGTGNIEREEEKKALGPWGRRNV